MKKKVRRKKAPIFDRTYRVEPGPVNYWKEADRLRGQRIVVYMPKSRRWKRGYLVGMLPSWDIFLIKWKKHSEARKLSGIWRVHTPSLFSGPPLLPVPLEPARVPTVTNQKSQGGRMATKPKATGKAAAKTTKKAAAEDNGSTRTRRDKLEGLSDAKKRNIAKLIYRERSKSPATSWGDITEMIQEKYDWTLPGSMTGRRLLRDHGPDGAEDAIIKQDRSESTTKAKAKKKATTTKKKAKKAAEVEDEDEDEDDDEVDDDDLEDEDEDEDEDDDDEDDDEDEDEEDEPEPPKAKKVTVKRGRGRKANPSK